MASTFAEWDVMSAEDTFAEWDVMSVEGMRARSMHQLPIVALRVVCLGATSYTPRQTTKLPWILRVFQQVGISPVGAARRFPTCPSVPVCACVRAGVCIQFLPPARQGGGRRGVPAGSGGGLGGGGGLHGAGPGRGGAGRGGADGAQGGGKVQSAAAARQGAAIRLAPAGGANHSSSSSSLGGSRVTSTAAAGLCCMHGRTQRCVAGCCIAASIGMPAVRCIPSYKSPYRAALRPPPPPPPAGRRLGALPGRRPPPWRQVGRPGAVQHTHPHLDSSAAAGAHGTQAGIFNDPRISYGRVPAAPCVWPP